jgi:hypothetical protein
MSFECIDTNVLIRYLVDTPETAAPRFQGVFPFFIALECGEINVFLPDLVLFQAFFVLTSYYTYGVPGQTDEGAHGYRGCLSARILPSETT